MSNFAISPSKYTLVTANDNSVFPDRRPKEWVLLGKRNINDPWTVIDHQSTSSGGVNSLPTGNLMPRIYFIGGYANNMQYFRFEVLHTYDDDTDTCMQLAEFYFN